MTVVMLPCFHRVDESYNGWAIIVIGADGWVAKWVAKVVVGDKAFWKKSTG